VLYIWILSNKFDLKQTIRVLHTVFMLSVFMLSVFVRSAFMLSVFLLSAFMPNIIEPNVYILSAAMSLASINAHLIEHCAVLIFLSCIDISDFSAIK
jgi:hypothetical protein